MFAVAGYHAVVFDAFIKNGKTSNMLAGEWKQFMFPIHLWLSSPGPSCSKLTTSLVNVSLKFQMLISQIFQYFLLKKCEKLLQCKSYSQFFQQKVSVYLLIKL